MKNVILLSILFLGMTAIACKKTYTESLANKRVVGQYRFEKVTVWEGLLDKKDITENYSDMILQLNDKNEAAIIDKGTGITYTGNWNINETYTTNYYYDDDDNGYNSNTTYTITIHTSDNNRQSINFYGKKANIGLHKIRFEEQKADGKYQYKLVKL